MHHIKILGHSFEAGRAADGHPASGFVGSPTKQLSIHKAFHRHKGMSVSLLPIRRETLQIQPHQVAGQVGIFPSFGQQTEAGIVGQQMEPAAPLVFIPPNQGVAPFQMISRRRPAQHPHPLALILRHIAEPFPNQVAVLQIMVFAHQLLPPSLLFGQHQAQPHLIQYRRFRGVRNTKCLVAHWRKENKSFRDCSASSLTTLFPASYVAG